MIILLLHVIQHHLFRYGYINIYIIYTRLHHNCAPNSDLYRCNVINNLLRSCGKGKDNYNLICVKYADIREG